MTSQHTADSDQQLIRRIRRGEAPAWEELIARYEGRLLAFVRARLRDRDQAEDIVQETFIGFLTSLPNYDERRSLETYLFTIASYKLTDFLRRQGRRPSIPLSAASNDPESQWQLQSPVQGVSTVLGRRERQHLEEQALVAALQQVLEHWRSRGDWDKIRCAELLFVRGLANKQAAAVLQVSEQTVANVKFEFLKKLKAQVRKLGLPEDVFPELTSSR